MAAPKKDDEYPDGGAGPLPGENRPTRRRGALPGADEQPQPAPMSTTPVPSAAPAPELADGLAMTEKQKLPETKVWGIRVSERHYEIGGNMLKVLATRYRLDQRQVGELMVQFLVDRRFDFDDYVQRQVGPGIDLDFFNRPS
ncbi:hypothetical protein [Amycolatopsis minnesotensis]|uniref:Uncharacterized protein n=1 Tax=Amycolatopsis minnesotensis TaxID=337894 RepID=A0ABN2SA84_9PSEU